MKDGLQSTIKDVVKQTLAGQTPVQPSPSTSQTTDLILKNSNQAQQPPAISNGHEQPPVESRHENKLVPKYVNGQLHDVVDEPNDLSVRAQLSSYSRENLMQVSPTKQESFVNRVEPLSANLDNKALREELSTVSSKEPITNDFVQKLQWKHKCEIEAIKHNAGNIQHKHYGVGSCPHLCNNSLYCDLVLDGYGAKVSVLLSNFSWKALA